MTWVWVGVGAAVGAVLRFLTGAAFDRVCRSGRIDLLPWGTLTVNVVGSFILGVLMGSSPDPELAALLGTGFCGGLTTYSTFGHDTWQLIEARSTGRAAANMIVNLALGLVAVVLGWSLEG